MTPSFTKTAPLGGGLENGPAATSSKFQDLGLHKKLRGLLALGFLALSTAIGYGAVLILIDQWYLGGSLGIF